MPAAEVVPVLQPRPGQRGGGVYDWIGRATATEFVGYFTSQPHVGTFRLTRPAVGAPIGQKVQEEKA